MGANFQFTKEEWIVIIAVTCIPSHDAAGRLPPACTIRGRWSM